MHSVVFDLQVGDSRALAFAGFEFEQESAAVVVERAQLVELGVEAAGHDAAVADEARRLGQDRPL